MPNNESGQSGFENCDTYTDSKELFEDMFKALLKEKQKELQDKRIYFAEKAGIDQGESTC